MAYAREAECRMGSCAAPEGRRDYGQGSSGLQRAPGRRYSGIHSTEVTGTPFGDEGLAISEFGKTEMKPQYDFF